MTTAATSTQTDVRLMMNSGKAPSSVPSRLCVKSVGMSSGDEPGA